MNDFAKDANVSCEDTISRQAAIDALTEYWKGISDRHPTLDGEMAVYADCKGIIKRLPSAQPEPKWIPCSERLPENRLYVLVTYKYEYGLIDHGITWYGQAEEKWDTSREVIAWMPLPEPYREEGDE